MTAHKIVVVSVERGKGAEDTSGNFLAGGWATPGTTRVFSGSGLRITPGLRNYSRGPHRIPGMESLPPVCKGNVLPNVLSLWFQSRGTLSSQSNAMSQRLEKVMDSTGGASR